jgi:hypothetical protein
MSVSPPMRFLAVTIGGWLCLRAAVLAPDLWVEESAAAPPRVRPVVASSLPAPTFPADVRLGSAAPIEQQAPITSFSDRLALPMPQAEATGPASRAPVAPAWTQPVPAPSPPGLPEPADLTVMARQHPNRWSAATWLLARDEGGGNLLTPGGTLGGSQAGLRFLYRLDRDSRAPLALSARVYFPLRQRSGAEAAAGLDWRPWASLPLHLLAERRQALGRDGRSAFSLTAYGGRSGRIGRRVVLDAYAQAGMVGLQSRDAFFDGAVRLGVPIGRFEIGGGAWAAAQPDVARFDIGPSVSMRLPAPRNSRLRADWRFRVAGDAAPGSGPAITLATDF